MRRHCLSVCVAIALLTGLPSVAMAQADLYVADRPADTGVEPNADPSPMWLSEDIWIRTTPDPAYQPEPYALASPTWTPAAHQNPEYRDPRYGIPNYVYVRVRNRGTAASTGNETLQLYWSKASTGLSWRELGEQLRPRVRRRSHARRGDHQAAQERRERYRR